MGANTLLAMIKAGAKIIDVRTQEEFKEGAYPNAVNIPLNLIPARVHDLGSRDQALVLYCASGARSAQAARFLQQQGFKNVVNAGGLEDMPS